ncbi:hypothetical protein [Roseibium aggregatum]|uniref:Uncharacterized protein n=1 Tax=Roseibium aggregatum TaxID=187304 RepID=A0A926NX85_9HYPH|nr:hypothetical protein [Roseibium aggregatum]MBD1549042.1 hypothetical protein [Roseibium aggregatum]
METDIVFFHNPLLQNRHEHRLNLFRCFFSILDGRFRLLSSSASISDGRPGRLHKARARISRCTAALWIGAALVVPATSAYAQSAAEEAFRAYPDSLKKLGFDVTNDPIQYDSATDTVTVPNFRMNFSGSADFAIPKKSETTEPGAPDDSKKQQKQQKQHLEYSLTVSSPAMAFTGLTQTESGIHADAVRYPEGAGLSVNVMLNGESIVQSNLTMTGVRADNYTIVLPKLPAEDPQHPASRWLPVLSFLKAGSYDSVETDEISGIISVTLHTDDGTAITGNNKITVTGYQALNFKDGVIGEYSTEGATQDIEVTIAGKKAGKETSRQGRTSYKDINLGNFLALLDPDVPETGNPLPLLRSAQAQNYEIHRNIPPDQPYDVTIASVDVSGVTVTKRDFDFLDLLDDLFSGKKPALEQFVTAAFQAYRSFGISDASMRDIIVTLPNGEDQRQTVTFSMGEIGLSEMSSDKIGDIRVSDMKAPSLPNGGSFSLGRAHLGNLDFAPYGPMAKLIPTLVTEAGKSRPDPMRIARVFTPRSISYGLEDLHIVVPGEGEIVVGKLAHDFSTTAAPIPTDISARTDNASIPVDALDNAQAAAFLKEIGLKNFTWSDETRLHWDEDTLELTLEKLMIDVQDLGRAEATMKFANVPKALFEDPQTQGQIALVSSAFVGAEISFADAGVTTKAIQKMAQDAGAPEETFIQALVMQAEAALQPINDPAFTKTVSDAVADFLANPGTFRVVLAPVKPVPVAQIVGSMVTPQVLPGLLNVQVTSTH